MVRERIFVTGATGFLGSHLVPALIAEGYEIAALYRKEGRRHDLLPPWHTLVKWISVVEIYDELRMFKPNTIINLATEYGGKNIVISNVVQANIKLPLDILEISKDVGCSLFINTDSFFAKPEFNYKYLEAYTHSKKEFLWWAKQWLELNKNYYFANLRLEHVFGPNDGPKKFTTYLFNALKNSEQIPLTSGRQYRDFIYVEDVVFAFLTVLSKKNKLKYGYSEYEVGTGNSVSLEHFVRKSKEIMGSNSQLNFGELPERQNEIMNSVANTGGLKKLGWAPLVSLEKGLKLLSEDFKSNSE